MMHTSLHAARPTRRARVQTAFTMILVAALAVGAAGCGGTDSSTGPTTPTNVTGDYDLATIQTEPLPATVYDGPFGYPGVEGYHESYVITVTGGGITLEDGGYYHMLLVYTADMDGEPYSIFLLETGTYEINGSRIVLTSDYGDESQGTVRDGEVSIQMTIAGEPTKPYLFRR